MKPNDDLARWGEPPASDSELLLANLLGEWLESAAPEAAARGATPPPARPPGDEDLVEAHSWIEQMIDTVATCSGVFGTPPLSAAGARTEQQAPVDLRLRVLREVGRLRFEPVASTHDRPTVLRDMRRAPEDPERVTLRTGDRVRIEVVCDRDGCVTVLNVGPTGTLNLLYPDSPSQPAGVRAGTPLLIADVRMTPPPGRERLYAVWSRVPLASADLASLTHTGATLRDMEKVHDSLATLRPEDWHSVMLELEHRG
jgi:hypothetical protein